MASLPMMLDINIAAVPIKGFGGLCVVAASLICAMTLPETRWFVLAAGGAGVLAGVAMIVAHRRTLK